MSINLLRASLASPTTLAKSAIASSSSRIHTDPITATRTATSTPSLPYTVVRNSQRSLPVYSDIRNGGSRYLLLIRNIKGDVHALRDDLASSLFPPHSPEAANLKFTIPRSGSLVLTGGRWKHRIIEWLRLKGF